MGICDFNEVFKFFESFGTKNSLIIKTEHDINKVRDKYIEILEAMGIYKELLRAKEKLRIYMERQLEEEHIFFQRNLYISVRLLYRNIGAFKKICVFSIKKILLDNNANEDKCKNLQKTRRILL